MRKAEKWFYQTQKGFKFKRKLFSLLLRIIFACDIPLGVKSGKNLELPHNGLGVVMHNKTVIGNNCIIYQNVTIGGNGKIVDGKSVNSGAPTIEDNVAIFAGACVLGPITIGKNSYIGANAVVTKNIPPNSLVVGNNIIKPRTFTYNTGKKKRDEKYG